MEETAWERVQQAWSAVGKKLSDWGVVSPRLMLAGGGLFLTLSNWGLLPSVCISSAHRSHRGTCYYYTLALAWGFGVWPEGHYS